MKEGDHVFHEFGLWWFHCEFLDVSCPNFNYNLINHLLILVLCNCNKQDMNVKCLILMLTHGSCTTLLSQWEELLKVTSKIHKFSKTHHIQKIIFNIILQAFESISLKVKSWIGCPWLIALRSRSLICKWLWVHFGTKSCILTICNPITKCDH